MSEVLIPVEQLENGIEFESKQINELIESSQLLFDSKKFLLSIPIAILALEEISKLRFIRDKYFKSESITKEEWNNLRKGGSHIIKLKKPYLDAEKRRNSKGAEYWEFIDKFVDQTIIDVGGEKRTKISGAEIDYLALEKLDSLKQDCFYLDWQNNEWFSCLIKDNRNEKEATALVLIHTAKWLFNMTLLHIKHPEISTDTESQSYQNYVNDPLHKKHVEFQKLAKSNKYQTESIVARSTINKH